MAILDGLFVELLPLLLLLTLAFLDNSLLALLAYSLRSLNLDKVTACAKVRDLSSSLELLALLLFSVSEAILFNWLLTDVAACATLFFSSFEI